MVAGQGRTAARGTWVHCSVPVLDGPHGGSCSGGSPRLQWEAGDFPGSRTTARGAGGRGPLSGPGFSQLCAPALKGRGCRQVRAVTG